MTITWLWLVSHALSSWSHSPQTASTLLDELRMTAPLPPPLDPLFVPSQFIQLVTSNLAIN